MRSLKSFKLNWISSSSNDVLSSNSTATVVEMEKVMTTIIEDSDQDALELIAELSDLLVTCVEKENLVIISLLP